MSIARLPVHATVALVLWLVPASGIAGGLTMTHPFAPGQEGEEWARGLAECIGSSFGVPVEVVPGRSLGTKIVDLQNAVREGQVDLAILPAGWLSDWPEVGVFAVPGVLSHPEDILNLSTSRHVMETLDELGSKERGFFLLGLGWQYQILAIRRDALQGDLGKLDGLKLRVSGDAQAAFLSRLGAAPVQLPSMEVPFAMSFGAIDGAVMSVEQVGEFAEKGGPFDLVWSDSYMPFAVPLAIAMSAHAEYAWGEKLRFIAREECADVTNQFNRGSLDAAVDAVRNAKDAGATVMNDGLKDWMQTSDEVLDEFTSTSNAWGLTDRLRSDRSQ